MNKRYIDFVQKRPNDQKTTATPVKPVEKPVERSVAKPVAPAFKPHFKPDFGPVRKTAQKPVSPAVKTVHKTEVKPVQKPVEKSVEKPAQRLVQKAPVRPVQKVSTRPIVKKPVAAPKPVKRSENFINDSFVESTEQLTNPDIKTNEALFEDESLFGIIEDYHPVKTPSQITKTPEAAPVRKPAPLGVKSPFIRTTANVEKRPLSNSIPAKKPVVKTPQIVEEASAPVTIIEKPEKDAHVGIIITVILTIVFGAAIGTVAFLLLPK